MVELLVSFFLVAGGAFALIGSIGLARLPDLFMRLHGPTKATTLGVGGILVASMLHFSAIEAGVSLHEVLVAVFLMITAPVSAHLVARTMIHLGGGDKGIPDAPPGAKSRTGMKNGNESELEKT